MLNYFKKNFDEVAILAVFAKIQFEDNPLLTTDENNIVLALTRSTNALNSNASLEEIQHYLSTYGPESLQGIANNVKGILHEIEFIQLENTDSDGVYASMFQDTNHQGYDIQFFDDENGLLGDAQLKATDNVNYVQEWMEKNDGEIIVTSEIAEKMGLASSGLSNEDLTMRMDDFISKMVDGDYGESLWEYVPYLSAFSISLIIYELWKRYKAGQMSYSKFKHLSMQATGYKASKIAAISLLLSIPVVNVVTTIVLLSQLLLSLSDQSNIAREHVGQIDIFNRIGQKKIHG